MVSKISQASFEVSHMDRCLKSLEKIAIKIVWTPLLFYLYVAKLSLDQVEITVGITTLAIVVNGIVQPFSTITQTYSSIDFILTL